MKHLSSSSSICFIWFLIFVHVLADKSLAEATSMRDGANRAISSRCTKGMTFSSNVLGGMMQVLCYQNIRKISMNIDSRCTKCSKVLNGKKTCSEFNACKVKMDIPSNCEGEAGKSCTLLFFFHGSGGNNDHAVFEEQIRGGINEEGGSKGFIGIYPQGANGWQTGSQNRVDKNVDEGAFVATIVSTLKKYYGWDGLKFAVGSSNGAAQTDRMAVNSGYGFNGIVAISGQLVKSPEVSGPGKFNKNTITKTAKPIAYLSLHGTSDHLLPPSGGKLFNNALFELSTVADTLNDFSTLNNCKGSEVDTVPSNIMNGSKKGDTTADITTFDCPKGYPVEGVMMDRGEHWTKYWKMDGVALNDFIFTWLVNLRTQLEA